MNLEQRENVYCGGAVAAKRSIVKAILCAVAFATILRCAFAKDVDDSAGCPCDFYPVTGLSARSWTDNRGSKLTGVLVGVNRAASEVAIKSSDGKVLEIPVANLSSRDSKYLAPALVKSGYVVYADKICRISGCVNSASLCIDIEGKEPEVMPISKLGPEYGGYVRRALDKGFYKLTLDKGLYNDAKRFIISRSATAEVPTVLISKSNVGLLVEKGVYVDNPTMYKKEDWRSTSVKHVLGLYDPALETQVTNGEMMRHHEYRVGDCEIEIDGRVQRISYLVQKMDEAVQLLQGWMQHHRNDPVVRYNISQSGKNYDEWIPIRSDDKASKLLIIKGAWASGSGFVAEDDWKIWMYTNEHVARMGGSMQVTSLSGERFEIPKFVQAAKNRDLFRFEIPRLADSFKISDEVKINDDVMIYGNSDGGGVATEIRGSVKGVGPTRIEVDADFVSGNSGSPILLGRYDHKTRRYVYGAAVAVATRAELYRDDKDWVKAGTRFERVRKYGERFLGVEWETLEWDKYSRSCEILAAFDYYYTLLGRLYNDGELDMPIVDYDRLAPMGKNRQIKSIMEEIRKCDEELEIILANTELDDGLRKIYANAKLSFCIGARYKAIEFGANSIKKVKWVGTRVREEGKALQSWYERMGPAFKRAFPMVFGKSVQNDRWYELK